MYYKSKNGYTIINIDKITMMKKYDSFAGHDFNKLVTRYFVYFGGSPGGSELTKEEYEDVENILLERI